MQNPKGKKTTYSYKKKREQLIELLKGVPDVEDKVDQILKMFGVSNPKAKNDMKKTIWTMAYSPFRMGGSVEYPITTEVEIIEEKPIGHGLKAFSFKTPKGTLRIAESVTGGIVGHSFEQVKKNVLSATKKEIEKQLEAAKDTIRQSSTTKLSNEKFFELYEK